MTLVCVQGVLGDTVVCLLLGACVLFSRVMVI